MAEVCCPLCGWGPIEGPYESVADLWASYDICECCGCEYGLDDNEAYYEQWVRSGCPWFDPERKPAGWSLESQLHRQQRPWPPERRRLRGVRAVHGHTMREDAAEAELDMACGSRYDMVTRDLIALAGPFAETAAAYCFWIPTAHTLPVASFITEAHKLLARLYVQALELPEVPEEWREQAEPGSMEPWVWPGLRRAIGDLLGDLRYCYDAFDPTESGVSERLPVRSDLAGDMADIYWDLIDGAQAWQSGDDSSRLAAVADWRDLWPHWGQHANGAIRCLFWLQRHHDFGPETDQGT